MYICGYLMKVTLSGNIDTSTFCQTPHYCSMMLVLLSQIGSSFEALGFAPFSRESTKQKGRRHTTLQSLSVPAGNSIVHCTLTVFVWN